MILGSDQKLPSGSAPHIVLTQEQREVAELLSTPKPKWWSMDETGKQKIRNFIQHLHIERGISLTDLGKLVGKSSGYMSYMARKLGIKPRDFEEARLAGIRQKVRKYERKPFDGTDEDKGYLLGLKHGDLYTYQPWNGVVRVSTSTTHPAMAELFAQLFSPYGHVCQYPRYKYDTHTYEWNLHVILDDSFQFLLLDHKTAWEWVSQRERTSYSYLAGIWDAEGSVEICENRKVISIRLPIHNTNVGLLKFVVRRLRFLGYMPRGLQLNKRKGSKTSKWGIPHRKNYWTVRLLNLDQSQSLLRKLPLRHREKVAMKELALSLKRGDYWKDVSGRVKALRNSFGLETQRFVQQAMEDFAKRHKNKTETIMRDASTSTCSDQVGNEGSVAMELNAALEETVESPAVLCTLQREAQKRAHEEIHERILGSLAGCLAVHEDFLCWEEEPCVVICRGCNSRNIVSVLVHESIHHALQWLGYEFLVDDTFDRICDAVHEPGFRI